MYFVIWGIRTDIEEEYLKNHISDTGYSDLFWTEYCDLEEALTYYESRLGYISSEGPFSEGDAVLIKATKDTATGLLTNIKYWNNKHYSFKATRNRLEESFCLWIED